MRTRWTKEEMESVLIQLNNRFLPFKRYSFSQNENGLILLGTGGYANVYEMEKTCNPKKKYAIKVLGFGEKHADSEEFRKLSQIQKDLSAFQNDVVQIIDFTELRVSLDAGGRVLDAAIAFATEETLQEREYLELQFILMEKLVPVLSTDRMGRPKLYPEQLANFEENEIMKLAYNIGTAIARAHEKKLLHRDIKLENVFYDQKKKVYKLGDFGIAKMTDDGMASTVAFTKGYGAPEVVGAVDEKYDNTADIYSFGIMLYLLLNELRFPDSENYNVNITMQYSKGYQFPYPMHDDYELCKILGSMCQYDPDDRYQSMDKLMNDIEGIMIGDGVRFKKNNIKSSYVVGFVSFIIGLILWKLTYVPDFMLNLNIWGYVFLALSGYIYWHNLRKKEHLFSSFIILGLGIYLLASTGFTWWKLLLVLGVTFSTESFAGFVACSGVVIDVVSQVVKSNSQVYEYMQQYKWASIVFLSFACVLLFQYALLKERDVKTNSIYFKKNTYWVLVIIIYGGVFLNGVIYNDTLNYNIFGFGVLEKWNQIGVEYNFTMIGLGGMILSVIWIVRELILKKVES